MTTVSPVSGCKIILVDNHTIFLKKIHHISHEFTQNQIRDWLSIGINKTIKTGFAIKRQKQEQIKPTKQKSYFIRFCQVLPEPKKIVFK